MVNNLRGFVGDLGGGNSNIFWEFAPRKLGKIPILTVCIFFRGVGEKPLNHQLVRSSSQLFEGILCNKYINGISGY